MEDILKTASKSKPKTTTRARASDRAFRIAVKGLKDAGLSVDKVCIDGGHIEIHCGPIDEETRKEEDGGLKDW